jgi:hypothetical protein
MEEEEKVQIAYKVVDKEFRGPHGPDGLFYFPGNDVRRKVVDGWAIIHRLCHVCKQWFLSSHTGTLARWHYCVNCKEEFPEFLKANDPDTYEAVKTCGTWRRWNR